MDFRLTYKDVSKDIERWMKKFGTPDVLVGGSKVLRGLEKAEQYVYDSYFDNKVYDALVRYAISFNEVPPAKEAVQDYDVNPFQERILQSLQFDRELQHTQSLWDGILAKRKRYYAGTVRFRKRYPDLVSQADLDRHKAWVAHAMKRQIQSLQQLGDNESAQRTHRDLDEFLNQTP